MQLRGRTGFALDQEVVRSSTNSGAKAALGRDKAKPLRFALGQILRRSDA